VVTAAGSTNEAVILLHGLARTHHSMKQMESALSEAGYRVYRVDYPTREKTVEELSREDLAAAVMLCQTSQPVRIHFVAHSLGNIVLRHYLSEKELPNLGRIVMLGPPNHGSEVVDKLGHLGLFQWINGPAGGQLGTDAASMPNVLPVPKAEIGVVAGTRSINWILSLYLPGENDGKVSLESAAIEGMKEFVAVPVAHPFLMTDADVIKMTLHFLKHGKFKEETVPAGEAAE